MTAGGTPARWSFWAVEEPFQLGLALSPGGDTPRRGRMPRSGPGQQVRRVLTWHGHQRSRAHLTRNGGRTPGILAEDAEDEDCS